MTENLQINIEHSISLISTSENYRNKYAVLILYQDKINVINIFEDDRIADEFSAKVKKIIPGIQTFVVRFNDWVSLVQPQIPEIEEGKDETLSRQDQDFEFMFQKMQEITEQDSDQHLLHQLFEDQPLDHGKLDAKDVVKEHRVETSINDLIVSVEEIPIDSSDDKKIDQMTRSESFLDINDLSKLPKLPDSDGTDNLSE